MIDICEYYASALYFLSNHQLISFKVVNGSKAVAKPLGHPPAVECVLGKDRESLEKNVDRKLDDMAPDQTLLWFEIRNAS